jgi:hypothetical protein
MQSWSLESFIEQYSVTSASDVWGISRQAIKQARNEKREIRIVKAGKYYEVRESKLLKTKLVEEVKLISTGNHYVE